MADEYAGGTAFIPVLPSFKRWAEKVKAETRNLRDVDIPVTPKVDAKEAQAELKKLGSKKLSIPLNIDAQTKQAEARIKELESRRNSVTIQIDADIAKAEARIRELEGKRGKTKIDVDAEIEGARAKIASLEEKRNAITVRADADTAAAQAKLLQLRSLANSVDGKKVNVNVDAPGAARTIALLGAVAAAAGGIGAIAPALVGSGIGAIGVLGGSITGVVKALSAYSTEQKQAAKASGESASSALSSAIAIRNAEQSVDDARRNQARVAQDSARSVADAERQVADAQEQATQAQRAVNDAREEAKRTLDDLTERVKDYALAEEDADLAVREAEARQKEVNKDVRSTALEKERAALSVRQAQERLADLERSRIQDTQELNKAQAAGVDGSKQVVAAKAQEEAANRRVQDAQQHLADTQRQAGQAQEDAAIQVARALQGVADAHAQAGAKAAGSTKDVDEFADAMKQLSPVGQQAVRELLSMKDGFERFQKTMQTAALPGFIDFLRGVQSAEVPVTQGLTRIGDSISGIGTKAGDLLKQPAFQGNLELAFSNTVPVIDSVGDGIVRLTDRMVKFGAESGQIAQGTSDLIDGLFNGLIGYYDNLQPHAAGVERTLESIGNISQTLLSGLGTLFGQVSTSYATVAEDVERFINGLVKNFTEFTGSALPSLARGFDVIVDALTILNSLLAPFVSFLGGLGGYVAAGLIAMKLFSGAAGAVATALNAINPAVVSKKLADSKLAGAIGNVGAASVAAGTKTDTFGGKLATVGSKAVSAAKYIPLVGVAVAAVSAAYDEFFPKADDLAKKLAQGGFAAEEAQKKFYSTSNPLSAIGTTAGDASAALLKMYSKMSEVEIKESELTKAQNDLTYAQKKYGEQSPQAASAANGVTYAMQNLEDAQRRAKEETKSHTEKMRDQQEQMLILAGGIEGYETSMNRLKEAQENARKAVEEYGKGSAEAKRAQSDYRQSMLDSLTAVGNLSDAQTASLSPQEQMAARTDAINRQLVILATQAGTDLPPTLQAMINKMDDSGWAAYGVTVKVDDLGNKILTLQPGKELKFPTDAEEAKRRIDDLKTSVEKLTGAYADWFNKYQAILKAPAPVPAPGAPVLPLPTVGGGATGGIFELFASGGLKPMKGGVAQTIAPNTWRVIGDRMSGDEAYIPIDDAPRSKAVLAQTAARMGYALLPMFTGGILAMASGGTVQPGSATGSDGAAAPALTTPEVDELTASLTALQELINGVVVPALQLFELHAGTLAVESVLALGAQLPPLQEGFTLTQSIVTTALWAMSATAAGVTGEMTGYFNNLITGLSNVDAAFTNTADSVRVSWDRIRAAAADPVRWVLANPFNAGIINAWNSLDSSFALGKHVNPVPIGFAEGGLIRGPGTGTSDSIPAMLPNGRPLAVSNGEFIVREDVTKRALPFLNALNSGQAEALQATGARGYAIGGLVADTGSQLNAALARGLSFAKDQNGKPYIWGGVGPEGYDCSGFMSAITNVLRGETPHKRVGVAASAPWPGFVRGLSSAFAMGSSSAHTAGTLAGVNVESTGNHVRLGGDAHGADDGQFPTKSSLPIVGGQFVSGGGGGFDPTAVVGSAFADTYAMIGKIATLFAGNFMGTQSTGIATQAADGAKGKATSLLSSLYAATGAAGSPEVVNAVKMVASRFGWGDGPEWDALYKLVQGESSWNPNAANPTSSARGLFQKMTSLHGPLESTPAGQAEWGLNYIRSTYGDPINAYAKWLSRSPHWYDEGGVMMPGSGSYFNGTGKPEAVLTNEQWRDVSALAVQNGGEFTGNLFLDSGEFLGQVRGVVESHDQATGTRIFHGSRI